MKLHYSATSPFVRKVMIVAWERGLVDRIEKLPADFTKPDSPFRAANPLGKVPALELDDGTVLFDSPVICEYLDDQGTGPGLIPGPGPARWTALRRQALADGILDAAVLTRYEALRPEAERSASWTAKQRGVIERGLAALEREAEDIGARFDIGTVAVVAALGYLDLRFPDLNRRERAPNLSRAIDAFADRASVRDTVPVLPS